MAKATRIKADPYVVADLTRAESALMELAALERKTRAITDSLNDAVDRMKEAAKAEIVPLDARKKTLTDALGTYLKMNRAEVLKDRKTIELAFGFMGFRASTAVCQMKSVTAEMTLQRMRDHGLTEGIRTKEELDKDAVRGWPAERLALVRLTRQEKDTFFVELKEENIAAQGA